jgi:hypothetical protein
MAKLLIGLFALTIFHLFSPWKVVIQRRSASDSSSLSTDEAALLPVKYDSRAKLQGQGRKKDDIERDFGEREHAFMKPIGEPWDPPRRSRDDSIKVIYDAVSPSDWLDLVESHDDHVCPLLFYFCGVF